MKRELDIYDYEGKMRVTLKSLAKSKISKRNKTLIIDFKDSLIRENLSLPRIVKYVSVLKCVSEWFKKDYDLVAKKDIEKFVSYLHSKQDYSPYTRNGYKIMLKRFFRWFKQTGKEYPGEVKWMTLRMSASELNLPGKGDLLNEEEVKRLIDTTSQPRDKALISVLYESGCRIGELASLQIKNLEFDEIGLTISVQGKTGSRKIRIIASTQHLMTWLRIHPLKDDREAPLWVNISNRNRDAFLMYPSIRHMLNNLFKKAGIKKRPNPHMFRHARATFMAQHLTEFQMNQYFGWKQGSDMPSTYVHMSGRDLDKAILQVNGISTESIKKEEVIMQPVNCPRCQERNSPGSKYCCKCAAILDARTVMENEQQRREEKTELDIARQLTRLISTDSELRNKVMDKLKLAKELVQ